MLRRLALLFAVLSILSPTQGCKKEGTSKESAEEASQKGTPQGTHSPAMASAETKETPGGARDTAERTPAAPREPAEPPRAEEAAPKTMTSKDGAVTAPLPAGEGWDCADQQGMSPGGQPASLVKCRRTGPQEFFFLMAKVYRVSAAEVAPPKELATKIFMATYQKLFLSHRIVTEGPVRLGSLQGHQVTLEMTHPRVGKLHKTEQVFTQGEQVFVLSGEGKAEVAPDFEKHQAAWFSGVRFQALKP